MCFPSKMVHTCMTYKGNDIENEIQKYWKHGLRSHLETNK
jgi:hypothetical protein